MYHLVRWFLALHFIVGLPFTESRPQTPGHCAPFQRGGVLPVWPGLGTSRTALVLTPGILSLRLTQGHLAATRDRVSALAAATEKVGWTASFCALGRTAGAILLINTGSLEKALFAFSLEGLNLPFLISE